MTTSAIPVRRVSFADAIETLDSKHFADDHVVSHLIGTLSAVFPDGEEFFVRSVRHYRSEITDPELKTRVNAFIGQEIVHGREHRAFNDRLIELGIPLQRIIDTVGRELEKMSEEGDPMVNLAITAALEHFTATMGVALLEDGEMRSLVGNEGVRQLLLWHAMEEIEHKSVAFDVYRHVGGTEEMRIAVMKKITKAFIIGMGLRTIQCVLTDRESYRRGVLRRSIATMRRSRLFSKRTWTELQDYNRLGFHPDDHDSEALLARTRIELFGPDGRVADKLATAA